MVTVESSDKPDLAIENVLWCLNIQFPYFKYMFALPNQNHKWQCVPGYFNFKSSGSTNAMFVHNGMGDVNVLYIHEIVSYLLRTTVPLVNTDICYVPGSARLV